MKWLSDLVESSHSSMEVLPVPCLCEFLLASYQDQFVGSSGGAVEGEADPSSHRSHYKRKRSNKDKVWFRHTGAHLALSVMHDVNSIQALERHKQLIEQLQHLISGPKSTPQSCSEVLAYFLEKLTLSHLTPRKLAINVRKSVVENTSSVCMRKDFVHLSLPHYVRMVCTLMCGVLKSFCWVLRTYMHMQSEFAWLVLVVGTNLILTESWSYFSIHD